MVDTMSLGLVPPESKFPIGLPEGARPRLFEPTGFRATPQVEWVEIKVKSVINRVQGMPFKWSVNPYRGCAHACVYCLDGDTPILMGDGTTKPLHDIRVGDLIYGTERAGWYRCYTRTRVLAHWKTVKQAFRIVLLDGTEQIASGDHRYLTDRGWKYVTGTESGRTRRPHITTGNKLMGVGGFAKPPSKDEDYKRGYLCGLIRGDGLVRSYQYERVGRRHGNVHQFRLAMTDEDALHRAQAYLNEFSVPTRSCVFAKATSSTRRILAIRSYAAVAVDRVRMVIDWPASPSVGWYKGFLAGIFDAEGTFGDGILRIVNTDEVLIAWTARSLRQLGFDLAVERQTAGCHLPIHAVRPLGGLPEQLRLLHSVDPAITRKRDFAGRALKSTACLDVVAIEPVGTRELFDITTGSGDFIANGVVSHNCFARVTHWYLDQDGVNDWSSRIYVKGNAPEVLRQELSRPSWRREQISIGTATDPYQPAEGAYRITRRILEAARDFKTPISLVTKSPMVKRDRDVLVDLARGPGASVYFSFTTVDPALAREIEPDTPPPQRRLDAMQHLAAAGVPVGVLLAPVLPGITDDEEILRAVILAAKQHGARVLATSLLHLGDVVKGAFYQYLEHKHPNLLPEYERLYRGKYAPRAFQQRLQDVVASLKRRLSFETRSLAAPRGTTRVTTEEPRIEQQRLF
jgi:DNA repair photolyase